MRSVVTLIALAAAMGCKDAKSDRDVSAAGAQSFESAMRVLCEPQEVPGLQSASPADRATLIARYIDERLQNPEAQQIFEQIAPLEPAAKVERVMRGARKAGIECDVSWWAPPERARRMISAGRPLESFEPRGVVVTVRSDAIEVNGTLAVAPAAEQVSDDDLDTLTRLIQVVGDQHPELERSVTIVPKPDALAGPVSRTAVAAVRAGYSDLSIALGDGRGDLVRLPLYIPEAAPDAAPDATPAGKGPIGIVVAVTRESVLVWSKSGAEGSSTDPMHSEPIGTAAPDAIGKVLAELVERRFAGERNEDDRIVTVHLQGAVPMALAARVMAAAHMTEEGKVLFPDLQLSIATF